MTKLLAGSAILALLSLACADRPAPRRLEKRTVAGTTKAASTEPPPRRWAMAHRPLPTLPPPEPEEHAIDPAGENGTTGMEEPPHDWLAEPERPSLPEPPEPPEQHLVAEIEPPEPEPASDYTPTAADRAFLDEAIGFLDRMAGAVVDNAGECDRMADALQVVVDDGRDLIQRGKVMEEDPARRRWFQAQAERRMMAVVTRMMEPLQTCINNPRLMQVFTSLDA